MTAFADYPLFLSLKGEQCLVAGFGSVGQRKLAKLLETDVKRILVLDLAPILSFDDKAKELLAPEKVFFEQRSCSNRDIENSFLVFACTDNFAENHRICQYCKKIKRLCNNITEPQTGNFLVPASLREGSLAIAISSAGNSPALSATLKEELEPFLHAYASFSEFLGQARVIVQNYNENTMQRQLWMRALGCEKLMRHFKNKDNKACQLWLDRVLPAELTKEITLLLNTFLKNGQ